VFQRPGSNALATGNAVIRTMDMLSKSFPSGLKHAIIYNPTQFISESVDAVLETMIEAVILVVLVVILFLQTWRAAIIPILAIPISLIGTLFVMSVSGFSLNNLSLFGLVLAIGIVVDDAIVVVENVERSIENGLSPREATIKAMREVTGPIIAIALVLCAVFVPIAFISGLSGQFYRQFALTIAFSTIISAFNSLTLSPALSATLLKARGAPKDWLTRLMDGMFGGFFRGFNWVFHRAGNGYSRGVRGVLRHKSIATGIYAVLLGVTYLGFYQVPTGYIPQQDKLYLVGFAQLPDGATLDRTEAVMRQMSDIALKEEGVDHAVAFPGLSINGFINSSSAGIVFVTLKPFEERRARDLSGAAIAQKLQQKYFGIKDAFVAVFPPPPAIGLGSIGGFKLQVEDRTDQGYAALDQVMKQIVGKAYQTPELAQIFTSYRVSVPQIYADLDRTKAMQLGVDVQDVFNTMQIYMGSMYVNDFNKFGRTYQVVAQADMEYRSKPDDVLKLQTKNFEGRMVPLGSVMQMKETTGTDTAMRYNAFRAADLNGAPAPGYSTGQAQAAITKILNETLPRGMSFEWTELTYQQILSGDTALYVFPICVLLVFLALAAQYESLFLPAAILLILPMSLLSAISGVWLLGGDNNIFTQISLFVLIGLASKNAILIVEFARDLEHQGKSTIEAAVEAARLRLRPILMTSFAFIMGVVPLVLSTGAGSEMRNAMGIAVFFGMLGVTFFGLFLTPVFYVLIRALEKRVTGNVKVQSHA
jgi:multidrug efflux pump